MTLGWRGRWRGATRGEAIDRAPRWVIVDTETAGLDPERDPVLAIGGVAVDDAGIIVGDSFEVLLKAAAADAASILVHGIGRGAQAAGAPPVEALAAFRAWTAGAPRVGFHADFDRVALRSAFAAAKTADDDARWLDLASLATALAPEVARRGNRSLDEVLAAFCIRCLARHDAAADTLATAELLLRLRALAARQGVQGFAALVRAARARHWLGHSH
jgi:DNA polymerase-3 subunit epsilon